MTHRLRHFLLLLVVPGLVRGAEFTVRRIVTVVETGSSLSGDPVEAFENALENAKRSAVSLVEGKIRGGTSVQDGRLAADWVEKRANVQIYDLKVLEKTFVSPSEVRVKVRLTAGYLNYARFWYEYDKTVLGATHRTAFLPGWGQVYNRELFSAVLYGGFFAFFYGNYYFAIRDARTEAAKNQALITYQIPALVFWTLAVSDAGISRLMQRFGLEQLKESYKVSSSQLPPANLYALHIPLWGRRF